MTCPGVDYAWAKATLARDGWTNEIVLADLPLAANASGGLVKKGAGRLVLNAANTFAGPVEVAGGTLIAGNDRAWPRAEARPPEGDGADPALAEGRRPHSKRPRRVASERARRAKLAQALDIYASTGKKSAVRDFLFPRAGRLDCAQHQAQR